MMNLTELEHKVMKAGRKTHYGDCLVYPQWSFAVCEVAEMDEKIYRGVVASLVKKGLVEVFDNEGRPKGKGKYADQVFAYTDEGVKYFEEEKTNE